VTLFLIIFFGFVGGWYAYDLDQAINDFGINILAYSSAEE